MLNQNRDLRCGYFKKYDETWHQITLSHGFCEDPTVPDGNDGSPLEEGTAEMAAPQLQA